MTRFPQLASLQKILDLQVHLIFCIHSNLAVITFYLKFGVLKLKAFFFKSGKCLRWDNGPRSGPCFHGGVPYTNHQPEAAALPSVFSFSAVAQASLTRP